MGGIAVGVIGLLLVGGPRAVPLQDGTPAPKADPKGAPAPAKPSPIVLELLAAHNREREKEKLPPLRLNPLLSRVAAAHARDMAEHGKMTHEGSDGSTPAERIVRGGYRARRSAENVAYGQRRVVEVVSAWMKSPGHRANILGDFEEMGAGLARDGEGRVYWCVNFGTAWPSAPIPDRERGALDAINAARAEASKPAVKLDEVLARRCRDQAEADAKSGDPKEPDLRKLSEGLGYQSLAGFTGTGFSEAEDVVEALRKQGDLLGKYGRIGIGLATDDKGVPHWVIVLARK